MARSERGGLLRLVAGQPHRAEPPDALAALAKAAAANDRAAVRTFLVTVGPHLLRVVRRVLGASHPDVDDVTQESAFAVMDALLRRRGEATVLHFVYRVAVLTAMSARRRYTTQQRERGVEMELTPSPGTGLSARASEQVVRELLDSEAAFDSEAPVLAGDEERIERIAHRVQKGTRRARLSPRLRLLLQSTALGVLIAGFAIAAIELSRWHPRSRAGSAPRQATMAAPSLARDQRLVPVAPEPAPVAAPGVSVPAAANSAPATTGSAASQRPPPETKFKTASELFADANQARVQGDAEKAIAISRQLEATFPNSTEGITTHLSLGVLYLQRGQPALALQELRIYRHIGDSALMAEALWGEEQALQQLGPPSEERAVLEELLQNYPRSAYAAAAEKRLAALNN